MINQTYSNLEIILVDDGSTDDSGKICDKYAQKDTRIKVVHRINGGLSAARNSGLDICCGDMIAFLDSDDAFCSDMLQKMLDAMLRYDADIAECNFAEYECEHRMNQGIIDKKGKFVSCGSDREGLYNKKEAFKIRLQGKICATAWNKLYRRHIWNNLRFREGQNFEDIDLILDIIGKAERFYVLDEALVMRRTRKGSITRSYTVKNLKDRMLAHKHGVGYIRSHTPEYFDGNDMNMLRAHLYSYLLESYFTALSTGEKRQ